MDAGPIDGPRMSRSQAKSKKKAKGRPPPRAAQPEDEDELGNAGVAPPSSDSDVDDSELNSEVSDISDNEVEELFMKMIDKKMELQLGNHHPKPIRPLKPSKRRRRTGR